MALKPEFSLLTGLATATVVYGVYQNSLPAVADVRSLQANNNDLAKSERVASWTGAAVVAGVSLIAKDPTVFIIGGATLVAMAWMHRHANAVNPTSGTTQPQETPRVSQAEVPEQYSAPAAPTYDATF
jgi:Ni,Fe-hydrogenase I large subunit